MNNIKYTFLLPAYKARYLEEALLSIQSQSYTDYKVLVSDDCSPEDLKSVFDKVCGDDSRFTYRRNEKNMGGESLVSHWNLLVDMCETEWLIMASDDDVYEPTFLEEIDKLAEKYPQVDILRARARRIENGKVVREDFNLDEFMSYARFLTTISRPDMVNCLANYVFRTIELKRHDGFPDFPTAAKSDIATAMTMSRNGIVSTKGILFTFRISIENLSSSQMYSKNVEQILNANLCFIDWYQENINKELESFIDNRERFLLPLIKDAYKNRVEVISLYLLVHLSLTKRLLYLKEFWKRGHLLNVINPKSSLGFIYKIYYYIFRLANKQYRYYSNDSFSQI